MTNVEKDIQEYNRKLSLIWKENSKKFLLKYKNDFNSFSEILRSLVGKGGGGVLRGIPKEYFPKFAEYILHKLPDIEAGKFNIFETESFPDKKPISYVSKVCHIINPQKYPVIYDTHTKICLKIDSSNLKKIEEKWNKAMNEIVVENKDKTSDDDFYNIDSEIWASLTK